MALNVYWMVAHAHCVRVGLFIIVNIAFNTVFCFQLYLAILIPVINSARQMYSGKNPIPSTVRRTAPILLALLNISYFLLGLNYLIIGI